MSIDFTNSTSYSEYALNSYIDFVVFKELGEICTKKESSKNKTFNSSALHSVMINSHYSCILFSAFSIESEINLLGSIIYTKEFFEEYIDKLPTVKKLGIIIEKTENRKPKKGENPIQGIQKLFSARDKYVHDKGTRVDTYDQLVEEQKKRKSDYSVFNAYKTVVMFDEYCRKYFSRYIGISLISDFYRDSWENWQTHKMYSVSSDLVFSGAKFPNLMEYNLFHRRHVGYVNESICIDDSSNEIVLKQK
jgi:hypothetical protein